MYSVHHAVRVGRGRQQKQSHMRLMWLARRHSFVAQVFVDGESNLPPVGRSLIPCLGYIH